MKKFTLIILLWVSGQYFLQAQEVVGGFGISCFKKAWTQAHVLENKELIYSFFEGKYIHFSKLDQDLANKDYDKVPLQSYRMDKFLGLGHSLKNSVLFISKRDSNFLFALTYNRIGGRMVQQKQVIPLNKKVFLSSFQVKNTFYLLFKVFNTKELEIISFELDQNQFVKKITELPFVEEWESLKNEEPFSHLQIIDSDERIDPKQTYSPIKIYLKPESFTITYDNAYYQTQVFAYQVLNGGISHLSLAAEILNKGSLSGAKYSSVVHENKLFSAVINNSGIGLSTFNLQNGRSEKPLFINFTDDKLMLSCVEEVLELPYRTKDFELNDLDVNKFKLFGFGYEKKREELEFRFGLFNFKEVEQPTSPILFVNRQKQQKDLAQFSTLSNSLSVVYHQSISTMGLILNAHYQLTQKQLMPLSSDKKSPCCVQAQICKYSLYQKAIIPHLPTMIYYNEQYLFGFYRPSDNQYFLIGLE